MNESEIRERFCHFSPPTVTAICDYNGSHDPQFVSPIVQGIIEKYLPPEMRNRTPETMESLNAFGIESITLMEIILDIQDALGLILTDAELRNLKGFDEATKLLSAKVNALRDTSSAQG